MQPTAEGESQKVKLKVRVNIHGIITVASASLVEKKQDSSQNENVEMENSNDNAQGSQDAPMETNGGTQEQQQQQQNGPENQEVREDEMKDEPQQKQSWTQRVGQWFSGVCVGSAFVEWICDVCCFTYTFFQSQTSIYPIMFKFSKLFCHKSNSYLN